MRQYYLTNITDAFRAACPFFGLCAIKPPTIQSKFYRKKHTHISHRINIQNATAFNGKGVQMAHCFNITKLFSEKYIFNDKCLFHIFNEKCFTFETDIQVTDIYLSYL